MRGICRLAALSVLAFLSACEGSARGSLESTIAALKIKTSPEGSRVTASSELKRSESRAEATWEVESPESWETYREKVTSKLVGFERTTSSPSEACFSKGLTGDTHSLKVERIQPGAPLRVRVTFSAHPD